MNDKPHGAANPGELTPGTEIYVVWDSEIHTFLFESHREGNHGIYVRSGRNRYSLGYQAFILSTRPIFTNYWDAVAHLAKKGLDKT